MANFYDPPWKKGDIIRDMKTGQPYLVIHLYLHTATAVCDATSKESPTPWLVILPRDYPQYAPDRDLEIIVRETEEVWVKKEIYL